MQAFDGGLGFRLAGHFDKAETFGAAGVALHHDFRAVDAAVCAEGLVHVVVAEGIGQVAHIQSVAHAGLLGYQNSKRRRWGSRPQTEPTWHRKCMRRGDARANDYASTCSLYERVWLGINASIEMGRLAALTTMAPVLGE